MANTKNLNFISGIRFTFREVEVLACLLHNRKEKKIANILSISPRTVESHVANIKLKISINSRDQILDFLEKSDKIIYLKKIYSALLIEYLFLQSLANIKSLVIPNRYTCHIINKSDDKNHRLLIEESLKKSGIWIDDDNKDSVCIYIQDNKLDPILSLTKNIIHVCFNSQKESSAEMDQKYININSNYPLSILQLISKIVQKKEVDAILDDFTKKSQNIKNGILNFQTATLAPTEVLSTYFKKIFLCVVGLILLIICAVVSFNFNAITTKNHDKLSHAVQRKELDQIFLYYDQYNLSSDNKNAKQLHLNYILLKHSVKRSLDSKNSDLLQYFVELKNINKFIKYLDIMHSAGVYIQYKKYDSAQSIKLLIKAKTIAENYINNMNSTVINFDNLSLEETLSELSLIAELPECYTKILYSLGRSYMLQGDLQQAKDYFIKSEYLGNELGLYEGLLSRYKGLMNIELKTIALDIEKNDLKTSKEKLLVLEKLYYTYKAKDGIYIINHKPFTPSQKIILKNDSLYQIHTATKLIEIYGMLISMTNDYEEIFQYGDLILKEITGYDSYLGLINYIEDVTKLKQANVLNELGKVLLKLYDNKVGLEAIKNALSSYLPHEVDMSDLEFIEQILERSKRLTKNADYHRKEAKKILIEVLKRK